MSSTLACFWHVRASMQMFRREWHGMATTLAAVRNVEWDLQCISDCKCLTYPPYSERTYQTNMCNSGNIGGVISGFIYLPADSPRFVKGHSIIIGFLTMSTFLSIFMTTYLRRENRRRDREYKSPADYTTEERALERERGDDASFFRYTV
jgi:hypothetical protein